MPPGRKAHAALPAFPLPPAFTTLVTTCNPAPADAGNNWTATLYKGSVVWASPMLYAMSFIFLFSIGGLTGLFLGTLSVDVHLTDTYFVVAHFHYVMMGGTVMAEWLTRHEFLSGGLMLMMVGSLLAGTDGFVLSRSLRKYAARGENIAKIVGTAPLPQRRGYLLED